MRERERERERKGGRGKGNTNLVDVGPDKVIQFVEDTVYHFDQQVAFLREGEG